MRQDRRPRRCVHERDKGYLSVRRGKVYLELDMLGAYTNLVRYLKADSDELELRSWGWAGLLYRQGGQCQAVPKSWQCTPTLAYQI